jgi:glycosidase
MAIDTSPALRNLIIYSIYVRAHSAQGTFDGVTRDLDRIKSMGVDVIWLMPIHPIGELNKKGSLGCPYSIRDYRSVNPEYGTLADFQTLLEKAHALGLKVMIDVVYNHTAHDSILVHDHPEFFQQDQAGRPVTTVPDWSDVIDLKHPHPELSRYLIDSLKYWVSLGVDGFRCDVASLIPAEFWQQARNEGAALKPGILWLAESVHTGFIEYRRQNQLMAISDSEIYTAFDLTYDYDIWPVLFAAMTRKAPVSNLLDMYRLQHAIYPANFIKLHFVENHDQRRVLDVIPDAQRAQAWTAFQALNDGAWLIYAGQESGEDHQPSLFEKQPIRWLDYPLQDYLTKLNKLKKHPAIADGKLLFFASEPAVQLAWVSPESRLFCLINLDQNTGSAAVPVPDGNYQDLLSRTPVVVKNGRMDIPRTAVALEVPALLSTKQYHSALMDG